ncbi:adenosine 5'-monophosphoramidase HINT3-like isoform X4 [Tachypleus tridentatus]|uniref:adenosine 5'-monophosphoramidase HINT3-like isoform X4 n=1 Tax=Tachypleus tridentatus TaxID=6853 RepID=UPI003FD51253
MSAYNINSECTFCTIATGKDPSTVILYQDEDYVAFEDISPAALHHYLIIPKIHIQDARSLTPEHIPMVEHMSELGMNLLKERGGKDTDTRLGYHWPPFTSVKHLHLHIIFPVSEMSVLSKLIFWPRNLWFVMIRGMVLDVLSYKKISLAFKQISLRKKLWIKTTCKNTTKREKQIYELFMHLINFLIHFLFFAVRA